VTLFPSGGSNRFVAGTPGLQGICETCHTQTAHHCNGGPNCDHDHYTTSTCTDCHSHKGGFRPMGCTSCHDKPQGQRRVIVTGAGGTLGDFGRAAHHVVGTVQDSDCVVCHSTRHHRQGTVELKDPDDATTVWPVTDAAAAGTFCLHCHDGDGAAARGGKTPFSDGATVPDVARNGAFAASAHAGSGLACTGCHGNGHGSNLKKLLTPFDGAPGTDNRMEEEGFCYGCHGSAGTVLNEVLANGWFGAAYSNFGATIETAFGMHTSHPVRDSQAGHVFDAGTGTREMECTSCHDPHQDTGRYWAAAAGKAPVTLGAVWGGAPSEKIGLFDQAHVYEAPSLGAVGNDLSGAPLPIDAAGASQLTATIRPDYNTFCLSCHAQALGTVTAVDWTGKKHGAAEAEPQGPLGGALLAPYASGQRGRYFLDCLDCHEAHGSTNTRLLRVAANGGTVGNIPDVTTTRWRYLCIRCHAAPLDHHNADVQAKAGVSGCSTCHPHGSYASCTTSGCHTHGSFF